MRRGKFVIDVEENRVEFLELTAGEARAMSADWRARVEGLRQRWETSGDREALLGALISYQAQLPQWLFKGLMATFEKLLRNPDATRFLAVRYAAYDWASENVTDPAARGGRDAMMKSYQKVRSRVAPMDRIQRRPPARRRRR